MKRGVFEVSKVGHYVKVLKYNSIRNQPDLWLMERCRGIGCARRGPGSGPGRGLHQVPRCAVEVFEHGNLSVGFHARGFAEMDPGGDHGGVFCVEIVGEEEIANPVTGLLADGGGLRRGGGLGDQEGGFSLRVRGHADPALAGLGRVFEQHKPQSFPKPSNSPVVVIAEIGGQGEGLGHHNGCLVKREE